MAGRHIHLAPSVTVGLRSRARGGSFSRFVLICFDLGLICALIWRLVLAIDDLCFDLVISASMLRPLFSSLSPREVSALLSLSDGDGELVYSTGAHLARDWSSSPPRIPHGEASRAASRPCGGLDPPAAPRRPLCGVPRSLRRLGRRARGARARATWAVPGIHYPRSE